MLNSIPAEHVLTVAPQLTAIVKGLPGNATENPLRYPNRLRNALDALQDEPELVVQVPPQALEAARAGTTLVLVIEGSLQATNVANGSVQFVLGKRDYFQVSAFGCGGMGRVWMPCFEQDAVSWDLEYSIKIDGLPPASVSALNVASSGALCQQYASNGRKTYKFRLDLPTLAHQISFAAGLFDMVRIPAAPFALAFCPRGMGASKLALAMEFFSRAFGFVNWYLGGASFPFPSYYVVFLRDILPIRGTLDGANVSLLSSLALFDSTIIDQNFTLRLALAQCLARQYFSIFLRPEAPAARWVTTGIAGYLGRQLLRVFHGNNDCRYNLRRDMERLVGMDAGHGPLVEVPNVPASPAEEDWFELKAYLVVTILDHRLEKGSLQKVCAQCVPALCAAHPPADALRSLDNHPAVE